MKNIHQMLIVMGAVLLLTACTDNKVYRIGVSQCCAGRWRDKVNHEMLAAQHLYEEDVRVSIACAYDDTEHQIRQIDSLARSGIDLLVVAPNEAAPLAEAIERTRQLGIPIIYFDRKAATDDYTAFIGGNNQKAGEEVAHYAVSLGGKSVLEITGTMSTSPAQERHQGFARVMQQHPTLNYVQQDGEWTSERAYQIVCEQVSQGHRPDIVFCHNDGMATGVYKALVELGLEDSVSLLGFDGLPDEGLDYVQQGHQRATYIYPTHGERIVRLALNILTDQPFERDNELRGMIVSPDNVDLIALNSKELMAQQADLVTIHDKLENSLVQYDTQKRVLTGSFVAIVMLLVAVVLAVRAYVQTRRAIRQRQSLNEEQTLLYTDPNRRHMAEIFHPQEELPKPKSQDMLFAEQLNEAIRKNMSNPSLKMDELGEQMGLGRVQLYRRVKALTGLSPVELLRQMRLQHAYVLLCTTTHTVAEIAYEVGFNTPGYFSKCFKEQYGKLPMELRESSDETKQTL